MGLSTEQAHEERVREVALAEGITASIKSNVLEIKGQLGSVKKDFNTIRATITIDGKKLRIKPFGTRRKDKAVLGTVESIVENMIHGVTKGFTYKLKVVFAHFPVTVRVKGKEVHVENFYGERSPRIAKILGDCKVSPQGDDVVVQGVSIEDTGQTAANIEQVTRVRRKDHRVFLDGLYLFEKVKN